MRNIPLAKPEITHSDIQGVVRVLKTFSLTRGPVADRFEKKIADYIGVRYAIATNSGTSALHLAVRALGIGEGDIVITTPMSFIASSNAILFERAVPVFVDIEPHTLTIDTRLVEKRIRALRRKGKRVKAILAIDLFGNMANWRRLREIARTYKLALIEDSCEALGSYYRSRRGEKMAGSLGDVAVFGFYPNKTLTTGEGGMLVTNDKKIAENARSMRNQGIVKGKAWGEYDKLGYNYHLADINCALGLSQLKRMPSIIKKRRFIASEYTRMFAKRGLVRTPVIQNNFFVNPFVYVIHLPRKYDIRHRDRLLKLLEKSGIKARPYFPAIHLTAFYKREFGYKRGDFPVTEFFADRALAIPFYHSLSRADIANIVKSVNFCVQKLASLSTGGRV